MKCNIKMGVLLVILILVGFQRGFCDTDLLANVTEVVIKSNMIQCFINLEVDIEENIAKPASSNLSCKGMCHVEGNKYHIKDCEVEDRINNTKTINMMIRTTFKDTKVFMERKTKWNCTFRVRTKDDSIIFPSNSRQYKFERKFTVTPNKDVIKDVKEYIEGFWIEATVFAALCLIIIGLVIIIVYLVCKAKRQTTIWDKRSELAEQKVRYTSVPVQSNVDATKSTERVSTIYEALDNKKVSSRVTDSAPPSLPPIETLPRSKPSSEDNSEKHSYNSMPLCKRDGQKTDGFKGIGKKTEGMKKYRSSVDLIKQRGPMPLPSEEDFYEDMDSRSTANITRHLEPKIPTTPIIQKKDPHLNKKLPPTPALTRSRKQPIPVPSKTHPDQPMMLGCVDQIREAIQIKNRWNGSQNYKPVETPLRELQNVERLVTRDPIGYPGPSHSHVPVPPLKPKPQYHRTPPPPPDRKMDFKPNVMKPAPAQPPPTKIHISTEYESDDSEEEWNYEDLSRYRENPYNI